jgi:N utilization substance protein A
MLRRLLELEVPEIFNGAVEIKAIAREAGSRSKVAVAATQEGIDPVGSCVGMRGIRIQNIVHELSGEKVDIVAWDPDTATFIANALSPARVSNVLLDEGPGSGKTATVVVPDDQLSLSIGKEGQNARLAAKLTNWRIDIKSISEAAEEAMRREKERERLEDLESRDLLAVAEAILMGKDLDELIPPATLEELALSTRVVNVLKKHEVLNPLQLVNLVVAGRDTLLALKGIGPKAVEEITAALESASLQLQPTVAEAVEEEAAPVTEAAVEEKEMEEPAAKEPSKVTETAEAPIAETPPTETESPAEAEEKPTAEEIPEEAEEVAPAEVEAEEEPTVFRIAEAVDEKEEELPEREQQAKKKRKKKRLVYDEDLGEVVARRKRKPGRRREDWEDFF